MREKREGSALTRSGGHIKYPLPQRKRKVLLLSADTLLSPSLTPLPVSGLNDSVLRRNEEPEAGQSRAEQGWPG